MGGTIGSGVERRDGRRIVRLPTGTKAPKRELDIILISSLVRFVWVLLKGCT